MKNVKIMLTAIAATGVIGFLPAGAAAAGMWKTMVMFNDGSTENVLYVGGSSSSTEGYDPLEEGNAYFSGPMSAYFYQPAWGRSKAPGGSDYYMSDIRSLSFPQTFTLNVKDVLLNKNISVKWNTDGAKEFLKCEGLELTFADVSTGAAVKIAGDTSYTYTNSSTEPRVFTVTANKTANPAKPAAPQNLTSNPGEGQVVLHWASDTSVSGFKLYRDGALISGGTLLVDDDGDGKVAFVDKSAPKGKGKKGESVASVYSVVAVGQSGCEGARASVEVTR